MSTKGEFGTQKTLTQRSHILVIDECPIIRVGLRALIEHEDDLDVIGESSNGQSVYPKAEKPEPDLVLLGIPPDGCDEELATQHIKKQWPHVTLLIFAIQESRECLRKVFQAGANGYLLKSSSVSEVRNAIRTMLKGGAYVDPRLGQSLLEILRQPSPSLIGRERALSPREQAVLKLVALGYSNKEIAVQLGITTKTVETHKTRAMNKLALGGRVELLRHAMESGWLKVS